MKLLFVADIILRFAKSKKKALTPMQVMKLTYIANGWRLGIVGESLFNERIEAWRYGPVMPDLYHATKLFGRDIIPLGKISDGVVVPPIGNLTVDEINFIGDVYDIYIDYDGIQLSSLTHKSGTPWDLTYTQGVRNKQISPDLIKEHYSTIEVPSSLKDYSAEPRPTE